VPSNTDNVGINVELPDALKVAWNPVALELLLGVSESFHEPVD